MVMERLQEPHTKLFLDNLNKVHGEWNSHTKFDELYDRLEQAIVRLSQANPDGAFPTLERIQETQQILDHRKEDSPGRQEIQESIHRFKMAIGMKLDSRRMFTTKGNRLDVGPQSLQEGDEIWILSGVNVPFILRRLEASSWTVVGQAFRLWSYAWRSCGRRGS